MLFVGYYFQNPNLPEFADLYPLERSLLNQQQCHFPFPRQEHLFGERDILFKPTICLFFSFH